MIVTGNFYYRSTRRNQRHALLQWPIVSESVTQHRDGGIADRDQRVTARDTARAQVLSAGAWAESAPVRLRMPGIGLVTSAWLLVGTLNVAGCAAATAAAAYVGLAPLAHESGSSVRGRARIGHGGHGRLRTAR